MHRGREGGVDHDALAPDGLEARELTRQLVRAGRQAVESVLAGGGRDLRLHPANQSFADERDGHTRQDGATAVGDRPGDGPGGHLRVHAVHGHQKRGDDEKDDEVSNWFHGTLRDGW